MSTNRIASTAKELGGTVESAVGDALGDHGAQVGGRLRQAEGRTERAYADARDAVREASHDAADYTEEAYGHASDYAGRAYERGAASLGQGGRAVAHQVSEQPIAALIIAGLVGYGLGLLVHRR